MAINRSLFAGVCLLALPSAAFAHNNATLSINNQFAGEAEVWIDGRFEGMVGGNRTATFVTKAGHRNIVVCRPATDFVLVSTNLHLSSDRTAVLPVYAPTGKLRVDNAGEVALRLQVADHSVWISPGTAAEVPVITGNVRLIGSIRDPRGEFQAIERTLWVEPGTRGQTTLRPDPTVVVITNRDYQPMRALVDGSEAGWVNPGQTTRIWVRPGNTQVLLLDRSGRVRASAAVNVRKGDEAKVVVQPSAPVINAVVTYPSRPTPPRPSGPVVVTTSNGRPGGPVREPGCAFP